MVIVIDNSLVHYILTAPQGAEMVEAKIIERRRCKMLKCEIPLDAISASNSFDTTIDQCSSVQTLTIPINGKQNIHLLKWCPCVFHVPTKDKASVPQLAPCGAL